MWSVDEKVCTAVTRIRTWVTAATTQGTNHYTITASCKHKCQEVEYTEVIDPDSFWIRGFRFWRLLYSGFRGIVVITSV